MADEQKTTVPKADSDGDEPKTERTAEELGEELLKRMDEIDARLGALEGGKGDHHDRLSRLEGAATGYAAAQHEHAYAAGDHSHETKEEVRAEKAPRAEHIWYRKFREKR